MKSKKNAANRENPKIQSVLQELFTEAFVSQIKANPSASYLSVQIDAETGDVQLYDTESRLLNKIIIFDWIGADKKNGRFASSYCSDVIRRILERMRAEGVLTRIPLPAPFTVRLVDEKQNLSADIYTFDPEAEDENSDLLKVPYKELDEFLRDLFPDVE